MAVCMTRLGNVWGFDMSLKMAVVMGKRLPLAVGWCFWTPRRKDPTVWAVNTDDSLGSCEGKKCWMLVRYSLMVLRGASCVWQYDTWCGVEPELNWPKREMISKLMSGSYEDATGDNWPIKCHWRMMCDWLCATGNVFVLIVRSHAKMRALQLLQELCLNTCLQQLPGSLCQWRCVCRDCEKSVLLHVLARTARSYTWMRVCNDYKSCVWMHACYDCKKLCLGVSLQHLQEVVTGCVLAMIARRYAWMHACNVLQEVMLRCVSCNDCKICAWMCACNDCKGVPVAGDVFVVTVKSSYCCMCLQDCKS